MEKKDYQSMNCLAIVAHDAGAANHIISWLRTGLLDWQQSCFCFQGPALDLAKKLLPSLENLELESALKDANLLISGTGWASPLEHDARKAAEHRRLRSVAVIDHWTNYQARFSREGTEVLPNEIWVVDEYAQAIAKREFPGITVIQQRNDFMALQLKEIEHFGFTKSAATRILYLMEPIRQKWGESELPGERQAFEFFIRNLANLQLDKPFDIVIKPHPSDAPGKYESWKSDFPDLPVMVDSTSSLAKLLASSDLVAGCQTYAMVVALEAGKKVISTLPPSAPNCVLPHRGITHLAELVSNHGKGWP